MRNTEMAIHCYVNGGTWEEIREVTGLTRFEAGAAIAQELQARGVYRPRKIGKGPACKVKVMDLEQAVGLIEEGYSYREAMAQLGYLRTMSVPGFFLAMKTYRERCSAPR